MKRTGASAILVAALMAAVLLVTAPADAQNAGKLKAKAKTTVPTAGGGSTAYPQRIPAAPDILARGKALYEKECGFCHGNDARGDDMGSNLIRSSIVLNDVDGELLHPVLLRGVEASMMPKFNFTEQQTSDIAAFLHSFRVNGYDGSRLRPDTIVVGDAKAGQAYFTQRCGSCHSATGDMKGIGTRINDGRTLQQRWLNPSGGGRGVQTKPTTVKVTASGQATEGTLVRIDDFTVTLTMSDGRQRTFRRDGDNPKVEVIDPYKPHKELLPVYTDKDIHDVTAYLVTLK
jgi:mono/diheme cytochrome c family protein